MPPRVPMHQPADIGRELLRLGAGQEHAVVERMQEPAFGDPLLFFNENAVHDRDLARGSAEAQRRDTKPDAKASPKRNAVTGIRSVGRQCRVSRHVMPSSCWWASCASPWSRRGTSDRRRRRAACRRSKLFEIVVVHPRQAERGREQARRFRRKVEPAGVGGAHHCRSRSSGGVERPNSLTMTSKVQSSPRWLQNTFSMSNGVASKRSATASTSDGATNRNTAAGSMKRRISHGQAMRSIFGPRPRDPDGAAAAVAFGNFVGRDGGSSASVQPRDRLQAFRPRRWYGAARPQCLR